MQFPKITMQSQMALIGINTEQGQQTIQQPHAQLSIHQPQAEVSINHKPSRLDIDQSQAWSDMGLYGPLEASEKNAQEGKQAWLQSMAKESQEGNRLMKIENKGNSIALISKSNAFDPMREFNVGWIPSRFAVKINYEPSQIDINVRTQKPIINATPQNPIIEYKSGSVETYLRQKNNLEIDVEI